MTGTPKQAPDGAPADAQNDSNAPVPASVIGAPRAPAPPPPARVHAPLPPPPLAAFGVPMPPPAASAKSPPALAHAPVPSAGLLGAFKAASGQSLRAVTSGAQPELEDSDAFPFEAASEEIDVDALSGSLEPDPTFASDQPAARVALKPASSLFDLDAPIPGAETRQVSVGAKPAAAVGAGDDNRSEPGGHRSTMEFLFELDAPARSPSREIDLEAEPELAAALTQAGIRAPTAATPAAQEPAPVDELIIQNVERGVPRAMIDLPNNVGSLIPPPERPRSADEQHQQRLRRTIIRIQTCRDAFRMLGFLGLADADRKSLARMLMEIDGALGHAEGDASAVKDPESALENATKEQLDAIERLVAPIEDRLLMLDELVPRDTFEQRVESRKQTKKVIARYGRLLASRRFQADQRRNRFEWIATHLLTVTDGQGMRHALLPDKARAVLQHLVAGLPYKAKEQELAEALQYLRESYERLQQFVSADEFFNSGFYLDVHGYKVTMRDQLLVPEFLYLSTVLNAGVHNRLEAWIHDLERLHSSNQLRQDGSPRDQITRGLRTQEEAVENALGVRRKAHAAAVRAEIVRPAVATKADATDKLKAKDKSKKKKQKKASKGEPRFDIVWDRGLLTLIFAVLVIVGSGGFLLVHTGVVGAPKFDALDEKRLAEISPVLGRGMILGEGEGSKFQGSVLQDSWRALDPRRRREEADRIAKFLIAKEVKNADIKDGADVVIKITDGFVANVAGGKL